MNYDDPAQVKKYEKIRRKLFLELCIRAWDSKDANITEKIGIIAMGIARTHDDAVEVIEFMKIKEASNKGKK